ncbi:5-oxoprolinase subunit PxpA [Litoribacter ruber]|uniref:5-oxoprolinase subunit PxpA n=1 Tax=Litoribacter ruber TaxID=702568 RepID=UPI001BD9E415|nr:5-oxoprolinase subunit PxpA [Litoribacter ruber]MBT0810421.1 5-oxoprolinase subunit PxpA [Litoribacter ruber]
MVDLNCDLGEGGLDDIKLMPYLTSCNISCGAHAGSEAVITTAIQAAKMNQVKIGAHPSYPDRENFGRKVLNIPLAELQISLVQQMTYFKDLLDKQDASIHHVKPHGALYNQAALDPETANCVIKAVQQVFPFAIIYTLENGELEKAAHRHGLDSWSEGFADRNYTDELKLVSRNLPHAVLTEKEKILAHVASMIKDHKIVTENGKAIPAKIQTLCIHGDNPNALEIAKFIRKNFPKFE